MKSISHELSFSIFVIHLVMYMFFLGQSVRATAGLGVGVSFQFPTDRFFNDVNYWKWKSVFTFLKRVMISVV